MPIHKLPNGKYKWGDHGKEYDSREGAERQAQAAYANGYKEKGLTMPLDLQACVRRLMADPTFRPQMQGDIKEKAANDVCQQILNKAVEDIQEALVIIQKFEDGPNNYSLLSPSDYDSYGIMEKQELEIPASSLTEDGNPLPSELATTKEMLDHAADPFQEVRLNNPQEPANMLGGLNPDTDTTTDVTNVTDNPMI